MAYHGTLGTRRKKDNGLMGLMKTGFSNALLQALFNVVNKIGLKKCFRQTIHALSFFYVCMVNTIYLLSFVETPRKFIIAELSIRKLGSKALQ